MLEGIYTCMTYIRVKITRIYVRTGLRLVTVSDSELLLRSICGTELARPIIDLTFL